MFQPRVVVEAEFQMILSIEPQQSRRDDIFVELSVGNLLSAVGATSFELRCRTYGA